MIVSLRVLVKKSFVFCITDCSFEDVLMFIFVMPGTSPLDTDIQLKTVGSRTYITVGSGTYSDTGNPIKIQ